MVGLSDSFAPYPWVVLAGHRDDGDVISLTRPTVNPYTPQCSLINVSHLREGCETPPLFDHVIRLEKQRRGNRDAKGLGRLEVDDQLVLHGLLHGQVRGLGALQDLVH